MSELCWKVATNDGPVTIDQSWSRARFLQNLFLIIWPRTAFLCSVITSNTEPPWYQVKLLKITSIFYKTRTGINYFISWLTLSTTLVRVTVKWELLFNPILTPFNYKYQKGGAVILVGFCLRIKYFPSAFLWSFVALH